MIRRNWLRILASRKDWNRKATDNLQQRVLCRMFAVQACRVICSSRQEQKRSTNFTPGNNNGYLPMAKLELQLSIMTLLSLLMGVWQNVYKELTGNLLQDMIKKQAELRRSLKCIWIILFWFCKRVKSVLDGEIMALINSFCFWAVLLMFPNKLLQILLLDFYTLWILLMAVAGLPLHICYQRSLYAQPNPNVEEHQADAVQLKRY